jgi:hypothetical protein
MLNVMYFNINTSRSMCEVTNMAVFCASLISRFPGIFFSDTFLVIFYGFQFPLLLLVLLLFLGFTCAVFPSYDLYILKTSRLLSCSHFSLILLLLLLLLILYGYVIIFIVLLPIFSNIKVTFLIYYVTVNIFVSTTLAI